MMSYFHPSLLRWFYYVRRMYIHFLTFIALDLFAACSIQDECVASVTFFICHPFLFQLLWLEPRMINIHRALCFSSHCPSSLTRRKCLCALAIVVRRRWRQRWCCWTSSRRKKIVGSTFLGGAKKRGGMLMISVSFCIIFFTLTPTSSSSKSFRVCSSIRLRVF
jgi:hypothetical protein